MPLLGLVLQLNSGVGPQIVFQMKKKKPSRVGIGVAWYRPNQYRRLLEVSEDRENMHRNYIDWEKQATENNQFLIDQGMAVEKIDLDIDEWLAWCKEHGKPFNGGSRSEFVLYKFRLKHDPRLR